MSGDGLFGGFSVAVLDDYQGMAHEMADWAGVLPDAKVTFFQDHHADVEQLVAELAGFDVIVAMRERTAFPAEVFARLPKLRLLVTTGMRNASIDLRAADAAGVVVCGTGSAGSSTTELAWALILALFRDVVGDDARLRSGKWQQRLGIDLGGQTLGLVGLGKLGSRLARVGLAFDMQVVAWSPNLTAERAAEHRVRAVDKAELFATSRVISLHLVLAEATRGIVGEPDLRSMRSDAFLVNTARAGLVDQAALRLALEQQWFAGAALDVYDVEPLPAEHWLLGCENVVLSPHMGYVSRDNYRAFYGEVVQDIAAYGAGTPIRRLLPTNT